MLGAVGELGTAALAEKVPPSKWEYFHSHGEELVRFLRSIVDLVAAEYQRRNPGRYSALAGQSGGSGEESMPPIRS